MRTKNEAQAKKAAERIRALMDSLKMNPTDFARYLGKPSAQPQIRRYIMGQSIPTSANAALIAAKGNGDALYYQGIDAPQRADDGFTCMVVVPYGGEVQAGVWREAGEEFDDGRGFPIPQEIASPWRDLRWVSVRGESMNQKYQDGTALIVASLFSNPIEIASGTDVVVQRKSVDGTYETSLKEYVRDANGKAWLIPRSTEPEFQAPLNLSDGTHEDSDVVIAGVVIYKFEKVYSDAVVSAVRQRNAGAADRMKELLARHESGESHVTIGQDFGISRERVRQLVSAMGGKPRREMDRQRAAKIASAGKIPAGKTPSGKPSTGKPKK